MILPTYNEAENVLNTLKQIVELPGRMSILVIDDGSPDGTADLVRTTQKNYQGRIHLIEREGKLGLGTAYIQGFTYAIKRGFEYICEIDADLSHNPQDLLRLVEPVRNGEADLVIGSRYINGVRVINWPLGRLFLSYFAGIYTRMITRLPIYDVTAGFKCYHRRVLEAIQLDRIKSNGYSFQVEMKYRAWRKGFRLLEVPIIFTERTEGLSKMSKAIVREAAFKVWELRIRDIFKRL